MARDDQPTPSRFDRQQLRTLLESAFSSEDLNVLCFDRFPEISGEWGAATSLTQKAIALITFCELRGRIDDLIEEVQLRNPVRYDEYQRLSFAAAPAAAHADVPGAASYIPPAPVPFVGYDALTTEIVEWLGDEGSSVAVITGNLGCGKSALARVVLHECRRRALFGSYVWWSTDYKPATLSALLEHIAAALPGVSAGGAPVAGAGQVYAALAQQRCLLAVSKVTSADHGEIIQFLRDIPSPARAIVTTSTSNLALGQHFTVLPLTADTGLELLRQLSQKVACGYLLGRSEQELRDLVEASAGLPSVIALVVSLAKQGNKLREIHALLTSSTHNDVSALCARVHATLPSPARDALSLICLSAKWLSGAGLAAATARSIAEVQAQALGPLRDVGLLVEDDSTAASLEDTYFALPNRLIRETIAALLPEADAAILREQLAAFYATQCVARGGENWSEYAWLQRNLPEILATIDWYETKRRWQELIDVFNNIYYFLGVRGYWHQREVYGQRVIAAAQALGTAGAPTEALVRVRVIGWTAIQQGSYRAAQESIEAGYRIYERLGDHSGMASACRYLGTIARREGRFDDAQKLYEEALGHAARAPDGDRLRAGVEVSIGTLLRKQGRLHEAEQHLATALALYSRLGHRARVAEIASRQADLLRQIGRLEDARRRYGESEALAAELGQDKTRAYNALGLALIARVHGQLDEAHASARQARVLFGNLGVADETNELANLSALLE